MHNYPTGWLLKKMMEEEDKLLVKCLLWSDIPFSITKNNPFYHPMIDVIAIVGPR